MPNNDERYDQNSGDSWTNGDSENIEMIAKTHISMKSALPLEFSA